MPGHPPRGTPDSMLFRNGMVRTSCIEIVGSEPPRIGDGLFSCRVMPVFQLGWYGLVRGLPPGGRFGVRPMRRPGPAAAWRAALNAEYPDTPESREACRIFSNSSGVPLCHDGSAIFLTSTPAYSGGLVGENIPAAMDTIGSWPGAHSPFCDGRPQYFQYSSKRRFTSAGSSGSGRGPGLGMG